MIFVLALGIGANTALFSIIDRVLLHPFPYRNLDRMVEVIGLTQSARRSGSSVSESEYFATHMRSFAKTAVWKWQNVVLTGVDSPDYLQALNVSEDLFDILNAPPQLGRTFQRTDFQSSAAPVVAISDRLWRRHFQGDASVIGRQILLDGKGCTVVGVMGPDFFFDRPGYDLWMPFRAGMTSEEELKHYFNGMALLRPDVSIQQAQREINTVTPNLPANPDREAGWHAELRSFAERTAGTYRQALLILFGAVGLVLLIACANAANLLLTRSTERRREFAIRASLGAGRLQLAREIFTEAAVLGTLAGIAGMALSFGLLRLLVIVFPNRLPIPQLDHLSINLAALGVTLGLAFLTTLLCPIPAIAGLWRSNLTEAFTGGSRTASTSRNVNRTRSALIALEVALSLILLVGAALMLRTLDRMFQVRLGFEPQHVLTARVAVPPQFKKSEQAAHYTRMLAEVRSLRGVQAAGITTILPFGNLVATVSFTAEGHSASPEERRSASRNTYLREISPDYFSTLGVRLLRGRDFNAGDTATSPPVVIVNDELARRYWPGEDPIGKRVSRRDNPKAEDWATIVGMVENIKHRSLKTGADAEIYVPYTQQMMGANYTNIVLRVQGDPRAMAGAMRKRIHDIAPDQPVTEVATMQTLVVDSAVESRFHTFLLEIFAGLALGLAVSGIFAVVSYTVTQRSREIGIRGALGATSRDVTLYVLGIAMRPVAVGACVGVAGGLAVTRVLQSELFETAPTDPVVFASVLGILIATAVVASALPAWRATRIDPATVLRSE